MIVWDDSILLGLTKIDNDHKNIVDHINRFIAAVESNANTSAIHDRFREMEHCIYRHLAFEEAMMKEAGYDQIGPHTATHEKLSNDLEDIWDGMLESHDFRPDQRAKEWLEAWLFVHVRNEDFLYRDSVIKAGLGMDPDAV